MSKPSRPRRRYPLGDRDAVPRPLVLEERVALARHNFILIQAAIHGADAVEHEDLVEAISVAAEDGFAVLAPLLRAPAPIADWIDELETDAAGGAR